MKMPEREWDGGDAQPGERPLLVGLVGPSGGGKTYSALRLATGMQRVCGGDIWFIDTEGKRALHYAHEFTFKHLPFDPPYSPLDYVSAIDYVLKQGARIVVIDSMTHEHSGPGGVMDQADTFLDRVAGDDERARQKNFMRALVEPKRQRRVLIDRIVHLGGEAWFLFCYRAKEGLDFKSKDKFGQPREKGYVIESTSPMQYEMTVQFLLPPGCMGQPKTYSEHAEESALVKLPHLFSHWFGKSDVLDEAIGERFGKWAKGEHGMSKPKPEPGEHVEPNPVAEESNKYAANADARVMARALGEDPLPWEGEQPRTFEPSPEPEPESDAPLTGIEKFVADAKAAIDGARNLGELKDCWEMVAAKKSELSKSDLAELTRMKDARKGELA